MKEKKCEIINFEHGLVEISGSIAIKLADKGVDFPFIFNFANFKYTLYLQFGQLIIERE